MGTLNSTGKRYTGHYSIWLTNSIQEMLALVGDTIPGSESIHSIDGWVNGNLYLPTNEVSGVLPVPLDLRVKYGMAEYQPSLHSKQPQHFSCFTGSIHETILPVHSDCECELFRKLVAENPVFSGTSGPQWDAAAKIWNDIAGAADGIAYKVSGCIWHEIMI